MAPKVDFKALKAAKLEKKKVSPLNFSGQDNNCSRRFWGICYQPVVTDVELCIFGAILDARPVSLEHRRRQSNRDRRVNQSAHSQGHQDRWVGPKGRAKGVHASPHGTACRWMPMHGGGYIFDSYAGSPERIICRVPRDHV